MPGMITAALHLHDTCPLQWAVWNTSELLIIYTTPVKRFHDRHTQTKFNKGRFAIEKRSDEVTKRNYFVTMGERTRWKLLSLVKYFFNIQYFSWNIFQHSKRNFVSPRGHVISSISLNNGGNCGPTWKEMCLSLHNLGTADVFYFINKND